MGCVVYHVIPWSGDDPRASDARHSPCWLGPADPRPHMPAMQKTVRACLVKDVIRSARLLGAMYGTQP
jgi:hypothetical protein